LTSESTNVLHFAIDRALLAAADGETEAAIAQLRQLKSEDEPSVAVRATISLGLVYRDFGDVEMAERFFRESEESIPQFGASPLGLNLGLAWESIGHPACARKVYSTLIRHVPFERAATLEDEQTRRIAALAAYRLGSISMAHAEIDEAWMWWQRALDSGEPEVAPYAARDLAMRIGAERLYPARIEELLRQAVDFDHPEISPQAASELGDYFAQRLQPDQAREYFSYAAESLHPQWARAAEKKLTTLAENQWGHPPRQSHRVAAWLQRHTAMRLGSREKRQRVVVVGAGTGGQYLLDSLKTSGRPYEVCGFVDDRTQHLPTDPDIPVLGSISSLSAQIKRFRPHEVWFAIPTAPGNLRRRVVSMCRRARVELRNLPTMHELYHDRDLVAQLRPVRIEETYGAAPLRVDRAALAGLQDEAVLLIGGAGTLGCALARKLATAQVRYLLVLDRNEAALAQLYAELTEDRGFLRVFPILADALDERALDEIFGRRPPSLVFSATGSSQPQIFDDNILSAAYDDIFGAANAARVAVEHEVPRFVLLSSAYAANPNTPFAASKALTEFAVLSAGDQTHTAATTIRIGNLFRAPGSPVDVFERQIELGGPVKVFGAESSRQFAIAPRAAELCLWAAQMAEPGMRLAIHSGESINLRDLAAEMIRLAGAIPEAGIHIEHAGPSVGEPHSRGFVGDDEETISTPHAELVKILGRQPDASAVEAALDELRREFDARDPLALRGLLEQLAQRLIADASLDDDAGIHMTPQSNLVS
jgi:FlaA1/EpsC-like NDP-sugar epimerase